MDAVSEFGLETRALGSAAAFFPAYQSSSPETVSRVTDPCTVLQRKAMGGKCGARTHAHYLHPETAGRYLVFGFVEPYVVLFKEEDKKELSEGSGACIVPAQLHVDLGMGSLKEKQCRSTHSLSMGL